MTTNIQTNQSAWQRYLEAHPRTNGFMQSTYITVFTDWFTTLGAKAAHFILIVTMVYMGAELFPGVTLPPQLNLTMFMLQFIALDLGGIGLKTAARQAEFEGNQTGADEAMKLGNLLINILFATIVVTILKQFISGIHLTGQLSSVVTTIETLVEGILLVARGWGAVRYGPVIHGLKAAGDHVMDTMREAIGNLEAEKVSLQRNLEGEKVSLQRNLETLRVSFEETIRQRDGFLASVTAKDTVIGNLNTNIEDLKSDMETLRTSTLDTIDGLRAEIEDIQAQKASMEGTIERLRGNLSRQETKTPMVPSQETKVPTIRTPRVSNKTVNQDTQVTDKETISIDNGDGVTMTFTGSTKDRIKAAMLEALQTEKEIVYKDIAEIAGTSEKYVKKLGPAIKKELGIGERIIEIIEVETDPELVVVSE